MGLEVIGVICSLLPSATVSCDVCSRCQPLAMELKKLFDGRWTLKTQFNHSKEEEEEEEAEDHRYNEWLRISCFYICIFKSIMLY